MAGATHAIIILALLIALAITLIGSPRRRLTEPGAWLEPILLGTAAFLLLPVSVHACHEGNPTRQTVVFAATIFVVVAVMKHRLARRLIATGLLLIMLVMNANFNTLVHTERWTGNPRPINLASSMLRPMNHALREQITTSAETVDPAHRNAGWLREHPLWERLNTSTRDLFRREALFPRREAHPVWHTGFTGLYREVGIPQDLWYPGGALQDVLDRQALALRDRPPANKSPAGQGN